jgi:uncharacterized protein YndB with AHSA1/START domain
MAITAPIAKVWSAIADWEGQSKWMLQTKVIRTSEISEGVDVTIEAFTGPFHRLFPRFRSLGVTDLMRVTSWQPPFRCDVIHYGKVIKGTGTFELESEDHSRTIFHWSEVIEAPRWIFILVKPFILAGVRISLARFRRTLE